jgi:Fe-S cluster assembly scaffold protein SufB
VEKKIEKNMHPTSKSTPGWASEMQAIMDAYQKAGGVPEQLQAQDVATFVISGEKVMASHEIPGIQFSAKPIKNGVQANIKVTANSMIEKPVHLCFGVVPEEGIQHIIANYDIESGARVKFLAHCSFPNAVKVKHQMDASINIGENASMEYTEEHYHGESGGIQVKPVTNVKVGKGGTYRNNCSLIHGSIGEMDVNLEADAEESALVALNIKAFGINRDAIKVHEVIRLNGENAHGLAKTRIAVKDQASSEVVTITDGNAPGVKVHMDCTEIVRDQGTATNNPVVSVNNALAQVTHEAAIGTVNHKELETLMARGLSEDEAVDLIIRAMIR